MSLFKWRISWFSGNLILIKFKYRRLSKIVQKSSVCPLPDSPCLHSHSICFISLYPHVYICIISLSFGGEIGDLVFLFLYLSMYFPRTKAYSYTNNFTIVAKIQKFNIAARLLCNPYSNYINFLSNVLYSDFSPTSLHSSPGVSLGSLTSQALYRRLWFHFNILLKAVWKLFLLNANLWKTVKTSHLPGWRSGTSEESKTNVLETLKVIPMKPPQMFHAMEAFVTSVGTRWDGLGGNFLKRGMTPRIFAYKFASWLDRQTAPPS